MTFATLSLTRATLTWERGQATRIVGYGVLSAIAYDGSKGILPAVALPGIHFKRKPREPFEFLRAAEGVGNDGLLLASFERQPPALGWAITLTLTDTATQAAKVVAETFGAAASIAGAFPPAGTVAAGIFGAGKALATGISSVLGARIVGTWISSELDNDDLGEDFAVEQKNFKSRFGLFYDVK